MNVIGIDPSLTNTAICSGSSEADQAMRCFRSKNLGDHVTGRMKRIEGAIGQIDSYLRSLAPGLILIEGYAFGAKNNREYLGEYCGVLKWHLVDLAPVIEVAPTLLKKFVTGKGGGKKDLMLQMVTHKWGKVFSTNDETDAFALWQLGQIVSGNQTASNSDHRQIVKNLLEKHGMTNWSGNRKPVSQTAVGRGSNARTNRS